MIFQIGNIRGLGRKTCNGITTSRFRRWICAAMQPTTTRSSHDAASQRCVSSDCETAQRLPGSDSASLSSMMPAARCGTTEAFGQLAPEGFRSSQIGSSVPNFPSGPPDQPAETAELRLVICDLCLFLMVDNHLLGQRDALAAVGKVEEAKRAAASPNAEH